jgi:hypothetical protein
MGVEGGLRDRNRPLGKGARSHSPRGPSKAKQIADALGVERTVVNNALYGPLRGKVQQSQDYQWSLTEAPQVRQDAGGSPKNSRERLFAYYLDCLSQDDDSGVRTFADQLDYVEVRRMAA